MLITLARGVPECFPRLVVRLKWFVRKVVFVELDRVSHAVWTYLLRR